MTKSELVAEIERELKSPTEGLWKAKKSTLELILRALKQFSPSPGV